MRSNKFRVASTLSALSLILTPNASVAATKKEVQAQAKVQAGILRSKGEPLDRCLLNAGVLDGMFVGYVNSASGLLPGDRLLSFNGSDLEGKRPDDLLDILRKTGATETVPAKIVRDGTTMSLNVQCDNARPSMTALLAALDFTALGKFDDCANVKGLEAAQLKYTCALFSRNRAQFNLPNLAYDALKIEVSSARWLPDQRRMALQTLRANESIFQQGYATNLFNDLVKTTKGWPGGEDMFEKSKPDWDQFRQSGETAISARLIDPSSSQFDWPHGFMYGTWAPFLGKKVEGYITCGLVNARNRFGGYVGRTAFVVVLDQSGNVIFSDMGTGKDFDIVASQCANSASQFPAPQMGKPTSSADGAGAASTGGGTPSLADELKKLTDLRNSGALTELEFQAAKQQLLGGSK